MGKYYNLKDLFPGIVMGYVIFKGIVIRPFSYAEKKNGYLKF